MRNPFVHKIGGVLSADIAVPEHKRELEFYSKVLTTGDAPLWRDDLMNNVGNPVIGLGARTPEYEFLPLQWMPHFQVADIAASVACAINMGGQELMHSQTEDGQSQWAVLADRAGAAFGLIPVVDVDGEAGSVTQVERLGCISWLSLMVPDAESSQEFYQKVIGWSAKSIPNAEGESEFTSFEMLVDENIAAAKISQNNSEDNIPSVWLIHLPVGDFDESLRRVGEGGGEVIKVCPKSKYAVVRDPVGAYIALQAIQQAG
jgi:predicted enzyme related to lactoylglutathione lyase